MKNLIFFNYYNNGDIHVSREFIKDILNKTNFNNPTYFHKNSFKILQDININYNNILTTNFDNNKLFYDDSNNIYINTWFHHNFGHKFYKCTLESLYYNFTEIYKFLNIKLEDISFYIPKIDFSKFNVLHVDCFFDNNDYDNYVFISNGNTLSSQSNNMNLNYNVYDLSKRYKKSLFILTEKMSGYEFLKSECDNVILSKDIIKSTEFDLNENSYLSTKCDIIIGRNSGPYIFSMVVENVLTNKKQDIIDISRFPDLSSFLNESYYNKNKKLHKLHSMYMIEAVDKILKS